MDDERFDGLYLNVAQTTRGIEPLLDSVFSFLRRKTDFFSGPPGAEDGSAAAIAKVNEVLLKHADLYKREKDSAEKKKEAKRRATRSATVSKPSECKEPKNDEDEIIEMSSDGGFDVSSRIESKKPTVLPLDKSDGGKIDKKEQSAVHSTVVGENDVEQNLSDEDKDGPPPEGNGGVVPGKYLWTQTLSEVMVNISVPENTRGRDLQVTISRSHLKVFIKTKNELVVDADLTKPIICDDSFWTVEDGNRLVINLQKLNQMEWWESVCDGDPSINVRHIRPENSSISDLDGETRKTVEKMMFDQRQKALGLPTIEEQNKLDALEMFKKQHPEMDFSNAKIS